MVNEIKIGILSLQGAVREHQSVLRKLDCQAVGILSPRDLLEIDGLIIPGGESTTIGKLLAKYDLLEPIIRLGEGRLPIFGTCTGLILLSKHISGSKQYRLGLMDIYVERNAFGRQRASFEATMQIPILGAIPYHTIFIRAPYIKKIENNVRVLLRYEDKIVFVEQDNFLATAFHPELTDDTRIHEYFIQKVLYYKNQKFNKEISLLK